MEYPVKPSLSSNQLNEMEERRLYLMEEAGINEREVLEDAKQNINVWQNYFNENITRGKDDMNFVLRDQWTAIERSEFTRLFKPAMTFNKLYGPIKKVIGEQRKNKPDLLVRSLTGKATQEQINLRADLVRTISYQSQNDLVYQSAFKSALLMGYGAFQVGIDYETNRSFNQKIVFESIPDATRCAFDPTAMKPHKGDGNYCSRQYIFTLEEFEATYPYINHAASYMDPRSLLDFQWLTKDTIVVADYFVKEWYPVILYQLSNGMVVSEDEWEKMQREIRFKKQLADNSQVVGDIIRNEIPRIVMKRQSQDYRIMHYRLIKNQIIDFAEWPSKQLPLIFVDGDSYYIEGKQYTRSFIHEARDAQKLFNYTKSEIAAEIKNRRREQWIGTPDNIIGNEQMWRNPETQNGILIAKPDPKTGQMPQKMNAWELSQALLVNCQAATQDMSEILGVSESEDQQGKDISGKARRERKMETSMSTYVWFDNLNQAIEQAGRVVLDLLPVVYGATNEEGERMERSVVISKKDGKTSNLTLNKKNPDGSIENELSPGEYDIEIDTGPSFAVQKEMAIEFLQETLQAFPQAFPLIADLWAKNLDVQFMPQIAERLKTLVPPQVIAKESGEPPPPPPPPSPQEQMMQAELQNKTADVQLKGQKMQLEHAEMQQRLAERQEEIQTRREKHALEQMDMILKAKEMAQKMNLDAEKNQIAMAKLDHDFAARMTELLANLHEGERQREHEKQQNHEDRLHEKEAAEKMSKDTKSNMASKETKSE